MDKEDGILCELKGREVLTWCKSTSIEDMEEIEAMLKRWAKLMDIKEETEVITEGMDGMYKHHLVIKED